MDGFLAHIPGRAGATYGRSARLLRLHGAGRGREKKKQTVRGGRGRRKRGQRLHLALTGKSINPTPSS